MLKELHRFPKRTHCVLHMATVLCILFMFWPRSEFLRSIFFQRKHPVLASVLQIMCKDLLVCEEVPNIFILRQRYFNPNLDVYARKQKIKIDFIF